MYLLLMPVATTLSMVAFAYYRGVVQRHPIRPGRLLLLALILQLLLALPACWGTVWLYRYLHPRDDWDDIAAGFVFFANAFAAPLVACVVGITAQWIERRRLAAGHCSGCGYNLTGNTSGRCPECGEEIPRYS